MSVSSHYAESSGNKTALAPLSIAEFVGISVLLLNDAWFLVTLRHHSDNWYLINILLFVIWLATTTFLLKYGRPTSLKSLSALFPLAFVRNNDGLTWQELMVVCIGSVLMHPALAGIVATLRWRNHDYIKAREANFIALLTFMGYSAYGLATVLWH